MSGSLTPGDPLGGDEPRREPQGDPLGGDEPRREPQGDPLRSDRPAVEEPRPAGAYGGARVPPGAFAPRERAEVVDPYADKESSEWWRRAVASILDAAIIGVVAAFVVAAFGAILNSVFDFDDPGGVAGALTTGLFILLGVAIAALLYAPLVMAATNGKTLGKMALGCRVVRADGRRVDFLWAAYREVVVKTLALGVAAAATGGIAYLVDYLWPLFDGRNRALHDIVVDSRVVND